MFKLLSVIALAVALSLAFTDSALAKGKGKGGSKTATGIVSSVTTNSIAVNVAENGGQLNLTALITNDTKITGDVVKGAKVTITVSGGKAVSIEVVNN